MDDGRVKFESCGSVYDPNVIAAATGGDIEMSLDLLGQGIDSLRNYITAIEPASASWGAEVHKVKGLAASLGASRLADVARHAEPCSENAKREAWLGLLRRELGHLEMRLFHH